MKTTFSLTFLALLSFAPAVFAEQECCWIDVKTGKQVPTVPASGINYGSTVAVLDNGGPWHDPGVAVLGGDGKTARNSRTGRNYAKEPDGCWVDIKTGKRVPTVPASGINYGSTVAVLDNGGPWHDPGVALLSKDGKSARNSRTGQNYALEPCPPPGQATGDSLKKVFESVHIGIGIGGSHTIGHDEHGRSGKSTGYKSLPAGCKCHPCTCSPSCHCGG